MTRHVSLMEVCGKSHPGGGRTHAWRLASASLSGEVRGVTRLPEQSGRGRAAGPAIRVGGTRPWGPRGPGRCSQRILLPSAGAAAPGTCASAASRFHFYGVNPRILVCVIQVTVVARRCLACPQCACRWASGGGSKARALAPCAAAPSSSALSLSLSRRAQRGWGAPPRLPVRG